MNQRDKNISQHFQQRRLRIIPVGQLASHAHPCGQGSDWSHEPVCQKMTKEPRLTVPMRPKGSKGGVLQRYWNKEDGKECMQSKTSVSIMHYITEDYKPNHIF